ncbi:MAG: hypothetical protein WAM60_24410 [Candidatus Promineifilaceae bacterium]
MSTRAKIVHILVVLIFVVTSVVAGAFAVVHTGAHDLSTTGTAFHVDGSVGGPAYSIAGHCDMAAGCGAGSG